MGVAGAAAGGVAASAAGGAAGTGSAAVAVIAKSPQAAANKIVRIIFPLAAEAIKRPYTRILRRYTSYLHHLLVMGSTT
jgi:hypothetical protein